MDRLTENNQDFDYQFCNETECRYCGEPNGCNNPNGSCPSYCYFTVAAERLREYELTGLSPDEVNDLQSLSEKMNLCDLVHENARLHNKIRFLELGG